MVAVEGDVATQQRFFREDDRALGRTWFLRFSPAHGADVWTGEQWNDADASIERLFTDPDFTEITESDLPPGALAVQ